MVEEICYTYSKSAINIKILNFLSSFMEIPAFSSGLNCYDWIVENLSLSDVKIILITLLYYEKLKCWT